MILMTAGRMALEHNDRVVNGDSEAGSTPRASLLDATRSITLTPELSTDDLDSVPHRSRLVVQLLANRGIREAEAIEHFLEGDWRNVETPLPQANRAISRIRQAIEKGERIVVFGDFDCDGVTSCALMTLALRRLGAHAEPYVPRHEDDGRGLNLEAIRDFATTGVSLIVTTDCGISNVDEVRSAQAQGIDVIVTDHHPPHGEIAPAVAVVNPRLNAAPGASDLAGVGVAFRMAQALLAGVSGVPDDFVEGLLDLVVIGTIADVVPLTPENWILARAGLKRLNSVPRPGIRALMRVARLVPGDIGARDISFSIAPRLNACGRMGKPELAVSILLSEDEHEADVLAEEIEALNADRQRLTEDILAAARAQLQGISSDDTPGPVLVATGDNWPYGVLGLVAGRLAEEYRRPVFVISRNGEECRGSARGGEAYDLGRLLAGRAALFRRFGGHAQAAGFTIARADLDTLITYIQTHFEEAHAAATSEGTTLSRYAPVLADCRLPLRRLTPGSSVYADLEALEPYGAGFVEPVFLLPRVRIAGCRRSGFNGRTLRMRVSDGRISREMVWSRRGDLADIVQRDLASLPPFDVAYTLRRYRRSSSDAAEWLAHVVAISPSG